MVRFGARLVAALVVAGSAVLSPDAHAQLYVAGQFGVDFPREAELSSSGTGTNGTGDLSFERGYTFSAALGVSLGRFRVEGEALYRTANLDNISVNGSGMRVGTSTLAAGLQMATGDVSSYGALGSVYYDIHTGTGWVPYIGVGAGVANVKLNVESVNGTPISFDEDDWVFAYQAGFGLAYQINNAAAVTLGYRYLGTTEAKFSVSGTDNEISFSSHVAQVGLRYKF
jgi:opacity protein-like surface antigen